MFKLAVLFGVAVSVSLLWLGGVCIYSSRIGWENLLTLHPFELSAFVGAAIAPVAVLWLVIGFIYYGVVVRRQSTALHLLLLQARRSSDNTEKIMQSMIEMLQQTKYGSKPKTESDKNDDVDVPSLNLPGSKDFDKNQKLWDSVQEPTLSLKSNVKSDE
ncbi:MAG: hypothetical protein KAJ75_08165 [Alphaproteobacteria bacterium]|nr:hypothetical protein [Alphaproteobacteria bacterium]